MTRLHTTAAALAGPRPGHVGLRAQPQPADAAGAVADDDHRRQQLSVARGVDTVSFAPLLQADPNSGVIITDWYANPKAPGERVKLTVAILDQDLRADALRVAGGAPGQPERRLGRCAGDRRRRSRSSRTSS